VLAPCWSVRYLAIPHCITSYFYTDSSRFPADSIEAIASVHVVQWPVDIDLRVDASDLLAGNLFRER